METDDARQLLNRTLKISLTSPAPTPPTRYVLHMSRRILMHTPRTTMTSSTRALHIWQIVRAHDLCNSEIYVPIIKDVTNLLLEYEVIWGILVYGVEAI